MDTYTHVAADAFEPPLLLKIAEGGQTVAAFASIRALCLYEAAPRMQRALQDIEAFLAMGPTPQQCRELARRLGAQFAGCRQRVEGSL